MNRILEVAPDEMLARAQTGVTTQALNDAAAAHGLFYPPDPGSQTVSTIGGNVATCAGGLRGLKYGVTRNYVLGLTVALPTGEIIRTGGRLWKDVAGYDLTRLMTGSEGTLGVITEVTVALLPDPSTSRTGLAYFDTLTQAGRAVAGILAAGVIPATLEFLDRKCMDAVEQYAHLGLHSDAGALLLFGDDGDEVAVARSFERIAAACADSGAIEVQTAGDATESEALLTARRCTLPALSRLGSLTILEDASVPRPRLAEMVARIDEIAAQHQVTMATFGHAGDGNLHPTCVLESAADTEGIARAERAFADVFGTAIELGGTITGEHGVGAAKLPYLGQRLGTEQMALLRRIKSAFDPAGILNPGKLGS
jgi:glycolate oxidase